MSKSVFPKLASGDMFPEGCQNADSQTPPQNWDETKNLPCWDRLGVCFAPGKFGEIVA